MSSLPPEEPLADPLATPEEDRIAVDVPHEPPPEHDDKIEGY